MSRIGLVLVVLMIGCSKKVAPLIEIKGFTYSRDASGPGGRFVYRSDSDGTHSTIQARLTGSDTELLGDIERLPDGVAFRPRFPLTPGLSYEVTYGPPGNTRTQTYYHPKPKRTPTTVVAVYPSAEVLPENTLRFYVQFSAPMNRGVAYEHLRILDESGQVVEKPFLELGEELWDSTGTRLTLLIEPGRTKRDLQPREELGPVLVADRRYTLEVQAGWPDASGEPLAVAYRKSFRTTEPIRTQVQPEEWKIIAPMVGTKDPLVVNFPRSLDRAILERALSIQFAGGRSIEGRASIGTDEMSWEFVPEMAWIASEYVLMVLPSLEDVAGNRVDRPFEVDLSQQPPPYGRTRLIFQISPSNVP